MRIALSGNPNSGKTTLFNQVTGKMEYVGNWPGVTVEKKIARLKRKYIGAASQPVDVIDLPGAYSIEPYTSEEAITRDFILNEKPDVLINIVDASTLERSLYFSSQLIELGIPMVIALNKQDLVQRSGDKIHLAQLEKQLGCTIVSVRANDGIGLTELMAKVIAAKTEKPPRPLQFLGKGTQEESVARQKHIKSILADSLQKGRKPSDVTVTDKIDRVVAHPVFGLPIFALILWAVYAFSINGLGGWASEYVNESLFGEIIPSAANTFFERMGVGLFLQSMIVDGAIGGVGAVLGFLPLIMVLFFSLALLEDSGYMARVAVVMDRYFKKIGLSGRSIIPMIVGTGCSIPGVMAARTIEDRNEKIVTTMLTPFVPCGAKLPIIALMAAVFFPGATWVFPGVYAVAGVLIIAGGLFLKRIFKFKSTSSFMIELPSYKLPSLKHGLSQMLKQSKAFIIKASTIILVMNTLIWFMQAYAWNLQPVTEQSASILASVGRVLAPFLLPLGFVGWQMAAPILTGFIAKENVVGTLAVILIASEETIMTVGGPLSALFTPVTAMAFLLFNLFTPPCFAAIGAMNSELGGKWLLKALGFQFGVGYIVAMLVTQIGTLVTTGQFAVGAVPALAVFLLILVLIAFLIWPRNANKEIRLQTN